MKGGNRGSRVRVSEMSSANPSVASSHGNLDEQIEQLMQCKPLSEQEVLYFKLSFFFFLVIFTSILLLPFGIPYF